MSAPSRGFTLIEAIVALALIGLVMLGLTLLTAQWFRQWNHAAGNVQQSERLAAGFDRFMDDIGAAEASAPPNYDKTILFEGTATDLTLWRTRLSINPEFGMELVHYALETRSGQTELVRRHIHLEPGEPLRGSYQWQDPVVLARLPFALAFSYLGADHTHQPNWHRMSALPASVVLTAAEPDNRFLPVEAKIYAEIPAFCAAQTEFSACIAVMNGEQPAKPPAKTQ